MIKKIIFTLSLLFLFSQSSFSAGSSDSSKKNIDINYKKAVKLIKKAKKLDKSVEDIYESMALQVPMKRIAEPEEVAKAIAFLASNEADYINGINLPVDGGRTKSL